jgi:hypothetical protein
MLLLCMNLSIFACAPDEPLCPETAPNLVRINREGVAALVGYQDGDAGWQIIDPGQPMHACVRSEYKVLIVCEDVTGGISIEQHMTTFEETQEIDGPTCYTPEMEEALVTVAGEVKQGAWVWLNGLNAGNLDAGAPWSFEFLASPGTYDLIATDSYRDAGRVMLRRGVEIEGPTTLEPIDLSVEGALTLPVSLVINNLFPEDRLETIVDWNTTPLASRLAPTISMTETKTAHLVPPSLLEPDDRQLVRVLATSGGAVRSAARHMIGSEPMMSFDLPPGIQDLSYSDAMVMSAAWDVLPLDYAVVELIVSNVALIRTIHRVIASRGWVDATATQALAIDTSVPGFDPRWLIDPGESRFRRFRAVEELATGWYTSSLQETVEPLP